MASHPPPKKTTKRACFFVINATIKETVGDNFATKSACYCPKGRNEQDFLICLQNSRHLLLVTHEDLSELATSLLLIVQRC